MVFGSLVVAVLVLPTPARSTPVAEVSDHAAGAEAASATKPHGLPLEGDEAEKFLRTAQVVERKPIGTGITESERLTLSDGTRRLHAAWKTVDISHPGLTRFEDGTVEVDFRDSYKFELAACALDKLLGLHLVPPVVERTIDGKKGALEMWVEGVMTEDERVRKGIKAPDPELWNRQMYDVRLLEQLTYNTDFKNVRNILVDPDFRIYVIDFSRAFRRLPFLMAEKDLDRFSRSLLERLERLDRPTLEQATGRWLQDLQISGLLKRRDKILAIARRQVAERGEAAVLFP